MQLVGPAMWIVDQLRGWNQRRRRVRVLVHRGVFAGGRGEHLFLKVVNLSATREIEITHVWFEGERRVHVTNPDRPLPARLRLDETFETWIPSAEVDVIDPERNGRVLLSTGKLIKSRLNKNVPSVGNVAGGGSR